MNFWHIQLHQGNNRLSLNQIKEILKHRKVIGLGYPWENNKGNIVKDSNNFQIEMKIGDIVLVRSGIIPIALIEVLSDSYEETHIEENQLDWFPIRRDIKVLDYFQDNLKSQKILEDVLNEHGRKQIMALGTLTKAQDRNKATNLFIKRWYESVVKLENEKMEQNLQESIAQEEAKVNKNLTVGTISLKDLFVNTLSIPEYQRPYEWDKKLVVNLFEDIEKHFILNEKLKPDAVPFFFGSILLHKVEDVYNVIDGQQRLTTILILDYVVNGKQSILSEGHCNFMFYSSISENNIQYIHNEIKLIKADFTFTKSELWNQILSKITLSALITLNESKAFQFFDSLNSTGKKLDVINIIKSYHLRELNHSVLLQKEAAVLFDLLNAKIENRAEKDRNRIYSFNDFIKLLWVQEYRWIKGNFSPITNEYFRFFFQKNSKKYDADIQGFNGYSTFPKIFPSIKFAEFTFDPLHPVQKGKGFFYSLKLLEKYYQEIFNNNTSSLLKKSTSIIRETQNNYFVHFYYLLLLVYYVKFRKNKIEEFAFEAEQFLGRKYLEMRSIRRESPIVILRNNNLLLQTYLSYDQTDVIELFRKMKNSIKVDLFMENEQLKNTHSNRVGKELGASRDRYVNTCIKEYYGKEEMQESNAETYNNLKYQDLKK